MGCLKIVDRIRYDQRQRHGALVYDGEVTISGRERTLHGTPGQTDTLTEHFEPGASGGAPGSSAGGCRWKRRTVTGSHPGGPALNFTHVTEADDERMWMASKREQRALFEVDDDRDRRIVHVDQPGQGRKRMFCERDRSIGR